MGNGRAFVGVWLLLSVAIPITTLAAYQGTATDSQIEGVIQCAMGIIKCDPPVLDLGNSAFDVRVLPPIGRIFSAAREAKQKYLPFASQHVNAEMLTPTIEVVAVYSSPNMKYTNEVKHLVLLPRGAKDGAIQPSKIEDWSFTVQNAFGATAPRIGKRAYFDIATLPLGDFDVVAVTAYDASRTKDALYPIHGKARQKLAQWCAGSTTSK